MSDAPHPQIIHVLIGQVHVCRPPHVLFAVLGSCVGVSIFDRGSHLGGMAHILLPEARGNSEPGMPGKYADRAVDCLLDTLLEVGADAKRLQAFVAGGAAICGDGDPNAGIGISNATVALAALKRRGIAIASRQLGGNAGRKVTLRTATGEHAVENLRATEHVLGAELAHTRHVTSPQHHLEVQP
jgi:chemotaxis protein CheD